MKWSESITFTRRVQDVCLRRPEPEPDASAVAVAAETAAYERGRRDGEKALSAQLLEQRGELLDLQQGVLAQLSLAVPQVVQQAENSLIQIALEAAKRVVAGMPVSTELVEAVVREAVSQAGDTSEVTVQLNPDDLALLRKHQSPILDGMPETGPLRFLSSAEVTPGGCLVKTRFGVLDARRETKLEQLRESIAS